MNPLSRVVPCSRFQLSQLVHSPEYTFLGNFLYRVFLYSDWLTHLTLDNAVKPSKLVKYQTWHIEVICAITEKKLQWITTSAFWGGSLVLGGGHYFQGVVAVGTLLYMYALLSTLDRNSRWKFNTYLSSSPINSGSFSISMLAILGCN